MYERERDRNINILNTYACLYITTSIHVFHHRSILFSHQTYGTLRENVKDIERECENTIKNTTHMAQHTLELLQQVSEIRTSDLRISIVTNRPP